MKQPSAINDTDDPFKELDEELENLRERAQDHAPPQVNAKTMIECDDELLTADTKLPSDREFRPNDNHNELKEEGEVVIDKLLSKRPLKQELLSFSINTFIL